MNLARYLLDTSGLVRLLRSDEVRSRWEEQVTAGLVGICPVAELEFLHTERSKADRDELTELLRTAFTWVPMPDRIFDRASEIQHALTARGTHRSAGAVDLLLAATAHLNGLILLHNDRDCDQIGAVTGQTMAWIAEPGSVP